MGLESIWEKKLDDIAGAWTSISARLKTATLRELAESGWLQLYGKLWGHTTEADKSVVWLPQDTTGRAPVLESNSALIQAATRKTGLLTMGPAVMDLMTGNPSEGYWNNYAPRTKILTFTCDGAGAAVAQAAHTATGAYYPVVRLKRIISTVTEGTALMAITSAGGALVGPAQISFNFTADVINTQALDLLLYNLTDTTDISIAWSSAGAGAVIRVEVEYHSET